MKTYHSLYTEYMGRQIPPAIHWVDDKMIMKNLLSIWKEKLRFISALIWEGMDVS